MFLPDRFIKGECPKCGAKDQYGDSCEVCGATYAPTDLKNPYSAVSGATPVRKQLRPLLLQAVRPALPGLPARSGRSRNGTLQPEAANKMQEWLAQPGENKLTDWDISRDAPYFGFEIPGRAGQVLLRLARRADRLHRQLPEPVRPQAGIDFDAFTDAARPERRAPSCTTSSARTSSTSTRCSGRPSCSTPATARRPRSSPTAS